MHYYHDHSSSGARFGTGAFEGVRNEPNSVTPIQIRQLRERPLPHLLQRPEAPRTTWTEAELPQFWPLYDAYRTERNLLGDRKVRLITDYLAKRDTMSEANGISAASPTYGVRTRRSSREYGSRRP